MGNIRVISFVLAAACTAAVPAAAGQIATRSALTTLLGGGGTLETFETFAAPAGGFAFVNCNPISATAICNGQGPGLVKPGIEISGLPAWAGTGYLSLPSQMIGDDNSDDFFKFTSPVTAFGVDLYGFPAFLDNDASMTIYGPDDVTVIGTITGISLSVSGTFAGWTDAGGIGGFTTSYGSRLSGYIANTDNLEFGSAVVPEPASLMLFGAALATCGIARRRRKA